MVSLPTAYLLDTLFFIIVTAYLLINMAYSLYLKNIVIIDIFCISFGFILRVLAGGMVEHTTISNWLLLCTGFLALFLALGKRRHELILLKNLSSSYRKVLSHYNSFFLDQAIAIVTTATLMAYMLYTLSSETIQKFGTNKFILCMPFVLYGLFRYLYLVYKKETGGSPTRILLTDKALLINILLWFLLTLIIIY